MGPPRRAYVTAPRRRGSTNGRLQVRFLDPDLLLRARQHVGPDFALDDLVLHALEAYLDEEDERRHRPSRAAADATRR